MNGYNEAAYPEHGGRHHRGSAEVELRVYESSSFVGHPLLCAEGFNVALAQLEQIAKSADVKIYVTSSFRNTTKVKGAIVTPAKRSNHLVGHAIDMNILLGNGSLANSGYLKKPESTWDQGVRAFIDGVRSSDGLRWGGDFSTPDVVHIDDGLNVRDPERWVAVFRELQ